MSTDNVETLDVVQHFSAENKLIADINEVLDSAAPLSNVTILGVLELIKSQYID